MEIALRGYRESDLEAMYALDVACFARPFRFSRSAMRRFATAKKARVAIAEGSDGLAGFGILHIESMELENGKSGRAAYVMTLDVDPGYRRVGLGRRLMAAMEAQAQADGCAEMVLHVFTGNVEAIRFYERVGFNRSHRAEGFYGAGLVGPRDAWVYRKRIESPGMTSELE
jgi:ribosomal-protein-alanine N-acetyltransferase